MTILNTFRSSRRLHTKRRGGAGDCDICSQQVEKFEKLNCTGCSDKSSKICRPCANIIKTIGDNCPMCRGKIDRSIEKLSERIAARNKVKDMKLLERLSSPPRRPAPTQASASMRPASPPRRPAPTPASPRRRQASASMRPASPRRRQASASRRLSPNTERDINTRELSANNRVLSVRKSASAASRREISRNRI